MKLYMVPPFAAAVWFAEPCGITLGALVLIVSLDWVHDKDEPRPVNEGSGCGVALPASSNG